MEDKLDLFLKELAELTEKYGIDRCPLVNERGCLIISDENVLDLIIRQQERIEELEIITGLANNRKYYRKFVDEVFCKQKGKELSEPDFDYIYQLYFKQQAEIEKWKAEYTRACAERDARICTQDYFKSEAIKEFAERLKESIIQENDLYVKCAKNLLSTDYQQGYEEKNDTIVKCIDNLLSKMAGEQDGKVY